MKSIENMTNQELVAEFRKLARVNKDIEGQVVTKQRMSKGPLAAFRNRKLIKEDGLTPIVAGDVTAINDITWPYFFSSPLTRMLPNTTQSVNIHVNQEAPLILTRFTGTVFNVENPSAANEMLKLIDFSNDDEFAPGLSFSMEYYDKQMHNKPIAIENIGHAVRPNDLKKKILLLPKSNLTINFSNLSSNTYDVSLFFTTVKIKVENAQNMLGTITA